jgi:uncharacterized protein (TIGR01627 family)
VGALAVPDFTVMCLYIYYFRDEVMKKLFKKPIKNIRALLSIELTRLWPSHHNISVMRRLNNILLSAEQLKYISMIVKRKAPCKLLIFGLGNDSVFWFKLNRGGITIFLENNEKWLQRITKRSKGIAAFLVDYNTQRADWEMLLKSPSLLDMTLPNEVREKDWDVIIVDAPAGYNDQTPGRMKSIYMSSSLAKNSGDIFVHDCNRVVEDVYCSKYLKKENLKAEIKAPTGLLRYYHITNHSSRPAKPESLGTYRKVGEIR